MKKLILKSSIFILPFILLYSLNIFFYNKHEGDLVRLGYLYSNPLPQSEINNNFKISKHYKLLSEINLNKNHKFNVLTIGDSFSDQDTLGYNNYLASKGLSVLHIDKFISNNPLQYLIKLLNSDFFDSVKTDYIVLQSVERAFNLRANRLNFNSSTTKHIISEIIASHTTQEPDSSFHFFSTATIKAPINNLEYIFHSKPLLSKTYKFQSINNSLFSKEANDILVYEDDIAVMPTKNDSLKIYKSIASLNTVNTLLNKQNITLIVLLSPDKYDLYYNYIKDNLELPEPKFFSIYEPAKKSYININTFEILSEEIKHKKDLYFYDDTHWSPASTIIIADKIFNVIKTNNTLKDKESTH